MEELLKLKRYNVSTDERYCNNRDSVYDKEMNSWNYPDENGKWVKWDDLLKLFPIKHNPTNEDILEYFGWECLCNSPYELKHKDGSFASKQAAVHLMYSLRQDYEKEKD